ncbi:unnamed protein product [Pseudo-nitzschia multistriata]|uniref:SLC41A/MgtE integral membrane domain-containing protein n=1 Tax=Pseudo-nitzschia multistriata TaxID=183589 RepID=A0A448ZST8_9STRA|nr:unnamed protein product [Pseudo-nitzschia multistriata]
MPRNAAQQKATERKTQHNTTQHDTIQQPRHKMSRKALSVDTGDDHQQVEGTMSGVDTNANTPVADNKSGSSLFRRSPQSKTQALRPPSPPKTSLAAENERLRNELRVLRRQIQEMEEFQDWKQQDSNEQHRHTQQYQQHHLLQSSFSSHDYHGRASKNTSNKVIVELPEMFQSSLPPPTSESEICNHRRDGTVKEKHSISTADDQETVEPILDIEAHHQSAAGLHHRNTTMITSNHTKKKKEVLTEETASSSASSCGNSLGETDVEAIALIEGIDSHGNKTNTHHNKTFWSSLLDRAGWLIGLLIFQSLSSFILARNESLLTHHSVIVQFLTMLVGAGGNAGNQASVGVVRGIAVGTIRRSNARRVLLREFAMGTCLSIILGLAGFVRAKVFAVPWLETMAITTSLFLIVFISVVVGATLPLCMEAVAIDPAHSSTTIQVVMDITGVIITVKVSSLFLDSGGDWLGAVLSMDGETR